MEKQCQRTVWSQQQDELLIQLVNNQCGNKIIDWNSISLAFQNHNYDRDKKACKRRYETNFDKKYNSKRLTQDQLSQLFKKIKVYGNDWKTIGEQMENRHGDLIKNQFYAKVNKIYRRLLKNTHNIKNGKEQQLKPQLIIQLLSDIKINNVKTKINITQELKSQFDFFITKYFNIGSKEIIQEEDKNKFRILSFELFKLNQSLNKKMINQPNESDLHYNQQNMEIEIENKKQIKIEIQSTQQNIGVQISYLNSLVIMIPSFYSNTSQSILNWW